LNKIPFSRFIITFLLFNKGVAYIVKKLSDFGYNVADEEISEHLDYLRETLPEKYVELIDTRQQFDINDDKHVQWLKQLGVFEYYDFIIRKQENLKEPPEYFKWCMDCMWAHGYKDVMVLINILLFNDEDLESISKVIMYKYRKKMSVPALELYKDMFWNCENITAKEALHFCTPFKKNALIIRHMRGGTEIEALNDESHDGSDVPFVFHDANYIKWKIGYREISVPSSRDFMERVKMDSMYKYEESMSMTRSHEVEEENGTNDKLGAFDVTKTKKRNVEEQRAKLTKAYVDLYIKANNAVPKEGDKKVQADFFEKMNQMDLNFGEPEDEKIALIDDMDPKVLEDIKGDMSDGAK